MGGSNQKIHEDNLNNQQQWKGIERENEILQNLVEEMDASVRFWRGRCLALEAQLERFHASA